MNNNMLIFWSIYLETNETILGRNRQKLTQKW